MSDDSTRQITRDAPEKEESGKSDSDSAAVCSEIELGSIVLDKYQVLELIGVGGMGSVFRVRHVIFGKDFALKCLNRQQEEAAWRRFQIEARAAQKLDHPNFVRVYEFGLLPSGRPYFVMDLVQGLSLADEMKQNGVLSMIKAIEIFIQVAFALE